MKSTIISRRHLLGGASAAGASAILARPASAAAEFEFKLGVNTPDTHPLTVRLAEAAKDIAVRSSGRLVVTVFPNSQLGGDPEMLSQLRAGGIELLAAPSMTPSTLVPLSGLPSVGFAFQSYDLGGLGRRGRRHRPRRHCEDRHRADKEEVGFTAFVRSPRPRAGSSTASRICRASRSECR